MTYATGKAWKTWMHDFRFGALIYLPGEEASAIFHQLRRQYDPVSASSAPPHITITQPFAAPPSPAQIEQIRAILERASSFPVQIGPAITSPSQKLIWFDVQPKDLILELRNQLHETGLFRTDLPLTFGFIPHLTISAAPREPDKVEEIRRELDSRYSPWNLPFSALSWTVPDEDFVFQEQALFPLKGKGSLPRRSLAR
jgi:2'-5' RNA ligase